jgi:hypothetical protein
MTAAELPSVVRPCSTARIVEVWQSGPWVERPTLPEPLRVETGWGHACGGDHPRAIYSTGVPGFVTFLQPPGSEEPCGVEPVDPGWQVVHDRAGGGIVLWGYDTYERACAGAAAMAELWDWAARDDWPPIDPFIAHVEDMVRRGL